MSLDVSGPPPPTWRQRAVSDLADLGLAILLVLALPLVIMALGLPLVWLVRVLVALLW